ncbi:tryptophan 2,3- dioxygenase [Yamadazyma tenuis]|uniref:Indoleamine 2,3-dioxygenase n=1 Tax=Candida tenuis (strain ATCC 10573 / BCRC 21748 / CBS 615 / JCM 9827 / NBRC 10315 / NRRL Y-1498 / VKM Y-70) TaxID=590646 RepID=G3BDH8_CANTC|nr:uncharacterized protein CANTEDRAFT_127423 [Yamadazyma tenuis ATCC 10573]EGV60303.1 hypothetical protein CANTEDRAFT_127423 [Yamadazyma tenuis ATCC 10573]WEJ94458.1 tryptophan 2,3- dioxygenase [Yamadazyma tenuis]
MINPEDYGVYPTSGFLPSKLPLEKLPQDYYKPWETIVSNLPSLILNRRVRTVINKLPLLDTTLLESFEQQRRAYQVLGFLAHGYIWGSDEPINKLPQQIAKPLLEVSEPLGLPPLATYAGLCLWNFKQIVPDESNVWDLDNLTTINTFTGGMDESWFYLISVHFEYKASFTVNTGLKILEAIEQDAPELVTKHLQTLAEMIDHLGSVLMRMEEMCDPHIFYFRIRPFLAGWRNMADAGLDKSGVIYGNDPNPKVYAGGSNAQSSSIQFLDALLNVKHFPTGQRPVPHQNTPSNTQPPSESNFMNEMREYMPRPHREFLQKIESISTISEYVTSRRDQYPELTLSYDASLAMLKSFRDKHIQIVTRYIILQAKKGSKLGSSSTMRSGLAKSRSKKKEEEQRGTGGTALLPFLKQCRDETGDPAAGNWGKRILSDGVMRLNFSRPNGINED